MFLKTNKNKKKKSPNIKSKRKQKSSRILFKMKIRKKFFDKQKISKKKSSFCKSVKKSFIKKLNRNNYPLYNLFNRNLFGDKKKFMTLVGSLKKNKKKTKKLEMEN